MILLLGFLMMTGVAVAQQLQVQGKVTDATGEGLIGASVLVKGTTSGVFVFLLLVEKRVQNGVSCHFGRISFLRSASPEKRRDLPEHAFRLVPSFCYVAT